MNMMLSMLSKYITTALIKKITIACLKVLVKRTDNKVDDEILELIIKS